MINETDKHYLNRCVQLAETALTKGDAPFGSLLVSQEGKILFEEHNKISSGDHTRHPEFEIAKWATNNLSEVERKNAVVYTSGEHCSMCASAHGLVGLGRIVYASSTEQLKQWNKEMGVESGRLKGLAIPEVIRDIEVDGPDETLAEKIRELQFRYHKKIS
ncbi:nucleoside deaminase [Tetragenococcus koreensis]|uniref:tRNA-specific adenosine deaminase n=1 Tax=Tetragenococcus koreensis TaxID=290335 RepID=A0AAN4UDN9_9ENTE|nr:nucleoside deaminase [Tetragenococcus koreensis]GEQ50286.1 tRNA-specific adenosine deaminase [Tetragenococcus koreensis]GEQ52779.1 tRNA-specific adenosine deaminase [Tetragenococcus koreensis]GEQ55527.1 tRNA-specific adenosine deaminase [Tetragenococcus koreensis]GEQ58024.1 tRNA-specific adenosine deaminase [Tetragenococcus koreensis]GEQ60518.1 tRNA-specific adenosine deaminase [Tetragenococcus koreensis]